MTNHKTWGAMLIALKCLWSNWLRGSKSPGESVMLAVSHIDPALTAMTEWKPCHKKNLKQWQRYLREMYYLPLHALCGCALCLCIRERWPFGRVSVSFWTTVSHLFITGGHIVDTAAHPELISAGMAEAVLLSITTHPKSLREQRTGVFVKYRCICVTLIPPPGLISNEHVTLWRNYLN